ncbi:MAG: ThiF family adenylyltransferase [Candidatus Neomarinimicrobiota bacterium]
MIITAQELQKWINTGESFQALDMRPEDLRLQFPLRGLDAKSATVPNLKKRSKHRTVLICQFGLVTEGLIIENELKNTVSLLGGVEAWDEYRRTKDDYSRYARQTALPELGIKGQRKINGASIAIVGLGGLGAAAAQILAAAGIGKLYLIDGDKVEISNIHRQPLYSEEDVNKNKTAAAAENLKRINSGVTLECINEYLTEKNGELYLKSADVIIDATDNISSRRILDKISQKLVIPLVYGGLFRFEGQVAVLNHKGAPGYRDIFPSAGEVENSRMESGEAENCRDGGILGMLPGIIGNIQALEALKIITGITPDLSGKILIYDGLTHATEIIEIMK